MATEGNQTSEYNLTRIAGAIAAVLGVVGPALAALSKSLDGWQLVTVLLAGLVIGGGGVVALAWKWIDSRTKVKTGGTLLLLALAAPQQACATLPEAPPYAAGVGGQYAADVSAAASSASSAFFGTGVALSTVGAASLAAFSAIPDGNLKAGEVPGSAIRAGTTVLMSGLVALGAYLIFGSNDLDALAAEVNRARTFGDDEEPGDDRDRWLFSLALEAVAQYHDAGAVRGSAFQPEAP